MTHEQALNKILAYACVNPFDDEGTLVADIGLHCGTCMVVYKPKPDNSDEYEIISVNMKWGVVNHDI